MATIEQRLLAIEQRLNAVVALIQGTRTPGLLYVAFGGSYCRYGCKVTQGLSAADFILALEGNAAGETHVNPDTQTTPVRVEDYPNVALIYGEGFVMRDVNTNALDPVDPALVVAAPPADAGYGRYDIVYAFVSIEGPGVAILTGTPSTAAFTDFGANGIETDDYGATYDPTGLPHGALPLARVYVQVGDTGVANARIHDLRNFTPPILAP
jgi:hypothetical protein